MEINLPEYITIQLKEVIIDLLLSEEEGMVVVQECRVFREGEGGKALRSGGVRLSEDSYYEEFIEEGSSLF